MKTLTGLSVFQIPFTVCAFSSTESNFSDIEDLSNILRCVCVWVHIWAFMVAVFTNRSSLRSEEDVVQLRPFDEEALLRPGPDSVHALHLCHH